MLDKKSDIAANIGSRICHDLISPIGAISNGLELLELSGIPQTPEMILIADSVRAANAKVRFLRITFGDASGDGAIGISEIADILAHYYGNGRLNVKWHVDTPLSRKDLKLCFLTLMCLENTLPYGGTIAVSDHGDGWQFEAIGDQVKTEDVIDLASQRFYVSNGSSTVQYSITQMMLSDGGYKIRFTQAENNLSVLITSQ
ncbi:histidine phosphotransferase [Amylibacter sp. SFDW26]|uniref:histidine phosphotransferase family protein n=1 Tax=Amylibacter sp. SFDW26 TaxID=2652722 RepID=UPI00126296DF|nr:histidine phosphotransferase family protein [Amylibacter sp. SFDW26]KAB7610251.1 histidine phosphotransferase [Amylibacter sp. SFDW26]